MYSAHCEKKCEKRLQIPVAAHFCFLLNIYELMSFFGPKIYMLHLYNSFKIYTTSYMLYMYLLERRIHLFDKYRLLLTIQCTCIR